MTLTLLLGLGGPLCWALLGVWAQAPGSTLSDQHSPGLPGDWMAEAETTSWDSARRNWCPYQKSRLVTFVAACKTERFVVHSQQPCPQGAVHCQHTRVMYRVAVKPVYQVRQKVLASVAWRCCPGFKGPDCQHPDPMATSEPADPGDGLQEPRDRLTDFKLAHPAQEIREVMAQQEQYEHLLGDLQNDVHQAVDSLPGLGTMPASNHTAPSPGANHMELQFPGRSLEQVLLPHLDAFLQGRFSPIWRSLNQSLHSLSQAVQNLSLEVEANRQDIERVRESGVSRDAFQELGTKFEAKFQENAQRVGQLRQDMEERLHQSLSAVRADMDAKVKHLHRAQEPLGAGARPEPESLQARLSQMQRNLSALWEAATRWQEEVQQTLKDVNASLAQHSEEIKELYSESDDTFDQIRKVERQVEELQVNHTELRELRVILMEKSLIMEENKEDMEQQLLELNLTLQHLQGGHADLIKYAKDCNCPKLYLDLDTLQEGQRNTTRTLEETQVSLGRRLGRGRWRRRGCGPSCRLLEDAMRHEAVLAALFGEEMLEELSQKEADPLPQSYEQIRTALREAAEGLREQALGWDALAARVAALEQAAGGGTQPAGRRLEPGQDVGSEEVDAKALAGLAREVQRLSSDVQLARQCCEASGAASLNSSLGGLQGALSATERTVEQHQQLFHSLFRNFQGLIAANVSLDLGKLQAMLSRKEKKKGLEAARRRDKKQAESVAEAGGTGLVAGALGTELGEAGSPVAFYASFSEGTDAPQMVKFNTTAVNIGGSYFPEHGYFQAPERGVYLFAVSVAFGPGRGAGQLVFGGHHQTQVSTSKCRGGSTVTTFAMAELQRGERVWFELTQGSLTRSPSGAAFGGFLMFKT
ncbi:Multimerin-2 [Tupaia chinensis]|uniref:Multimerin-2 n=1 Tax=Tupaia chinensis TaxID=246437 RepID=L9KVF0_TUPCH|nr:Multimerin-2 [Tupaia chinensis]